MTDLQAKGFNLAAIWKMQKTIRLPVQTRDGVVTGMFLVKDMPTHLLKTILRRPEGMGIEYTVAELRTIHQEVAGRPYVPPQPPEWFGPITPIR